MRVLSKIFVGGTMLCELIHLRPTQWRSYQSSLVIRRHPFKGSPLSVKSSKVK